MLSLSFADRYLNIQLIESIHQRKLKRYENILGEPVYCIKDLEGNSGYRAHKKLIPKSLHNVCICVCIHIYIYIYIHSEVSGAKILNTID